MMDCTPDDDGYCTGGCVTRQHTWSPSGARCTECNLAGTGDMCNDGNCKCECDEEYGPCEDHCTVLVQREGASTRTADDLLYVYLCDVVDLIADQTGDENVLSPWGEDVLERAGALLDQNDHYGCRWLPEDEGEQMYDEMTTLQYQLEASVSTLDQTIWTTWNDGFWIVEVHEDCPLLDD